jgi:hypothetical protein
MPKELSECNAMANAACYWNEQSNDLNYNFRNVTKKSGICIKPSVLYNNKKT